MAADNKVTAMASVGTAMAAVRGPGWQGEGRPARRARRAVGAVVAGLRLVPVLPVLAVSPSCSSSPASVRLAGAS